MAKGRKPIVALGDAKKFAGRQGYIWVPNPEPDIPFDAFAFRGNDMIALRVETCRNAPGVYDLHRDFFRNAFEILQKLPLPPYLPREVWVRYSWSREFHRFRLFGADFIEITMIDRDKPVYPFEPVPLPSAPSGDPEKESRK